MLYPTNLREYCKFFYCGICYSSGEGVNISELYRKYTNQNPWGLCRKGLWPCKGWFLASCILYSLQILHCENLKKKPDFSIDSKAMSANARPSRPFLLCIKVPNSCKRVCAKISISVINTQPSARPRRPIKTRRPQKTVAEYSLHTSLGWCPCVFLFSLH